jgi:hypothetical protein
VVEVPSTTARFLLWMTLGLDFDFGIMQIKLAAL